MFRACRIIIIITIRIMILVIMIIMTNIIVGMVILILILRLPFISSAIWREFLGGPTPSFARA